MAPGAHIVLVEATNNSYLNLMAAEEMAQRWPGVRYISNSWGGDEFVGETSNR